MNFWKSIVFRTEENPLVYERVRCYIKIKLGLLPDALSIYLALWKGHFILYPSKLKKFGRLCYEKKEQGLVIVEDISNETVAYSEEEREKLEFTVFLKEGKLPMKVSEELFQRGISKKKSPKVFLIIKFSFDKNQIKNYGVDSKLIPSPEDLGLLFSKLNVKPSEICEKLGFPHEVDENGRRKKSYVLKFICDENIQLNVNTKISVKLEFEKGGTFCGLDYLALKILNFHMYKNINEKFDNSPLINEKVLSEYLKTIKNPIVQKQIKFAFSPYCKTELGKDYLERINFSRGSVFYGPPGGGKTRLCLEICNKIGIKIINKDFELSAGRFISHKVGKTSENFKIEADLCRKIPNVLHCMILDEMDSICVNRQKEKLEQHRIEVVERMLPILSNSNDMYNNLVFLGCTNFIGEIDPGILRPGRLNFCVYLSTLMKKRKLEILLEKFKFQEENHKMRVELKTKINIIQKLTINFTIGQFYHLLTLFKTKNISTKRFLEKLEKKVRKYNYFYDTTSPNLTFNKLHPLQYGTVEKRRWDKYVNEEFKEFMEENQIIGNMLLFNGKVNENGESYFLFDACSKLNFVKKFLFFDSNKDAVVKTFLEPFIEALDIQRIWYVCKNTIQKKSLDEELREIQIESKKISSSCVVIILEDFVNLNYGVSFTEEDTRRTEKLDRSSKANSYQRGNENQYQKQKGKIHTTRNQNSSSNQEQDVTTKSFGGSVSGSVGLMGKFIPYIQVGLGGNISYQKANIKGKCTTQCFSKDESEIDSKTNSSTEREHYLMNASEQKSSSKSKSHNRGSVSKIELQSSKEYHSIVRFCLNNVELDINNLCQNVEGKIDYKPVVLLVVENSHVLNFVKRSIYWGKRTGGTRKKFFKELTCGLDDIVGDINGGEINFNLRNSRIECLIINGEQNELKRFLADKKMKFMEKLSIIDFRKVIFVVSGKNDRFIFEFFGEDIEIGEVILKRTVSNHFEFEKTMKK